jgi:hypothetical protein
MSKAGTESRKVILAHGAVCEYSRREEPPECPDYVVASLFTSHISNISGIKNPIIISAIAASIVKIL